MLLSKGEPYIQFRGPYGHSDFRAHPTHRKVPVVEALPFVGLGEQDGVAGKEKRNSLAHAPGIFGGIYVAKGKAKLRGLVLT